MADPPDSSHPSAASAAARYSRTRHRSRQHESAHADPSEHPPEKMIDHPLVPRGPGELITSDAALHALLDHLRSQGAFAYDSEFIGELSYRPRLCVIQVATTQRVALIDPLAAIDLTPFWQLLADPAVEKIVHAGEQDIEPVHRLIGQRCANILDTQIAAGFVGLAYPVGLSKLVHELLGVKLGKGLTFTHWDQRPLSSLQLRYAADDVRYLPALRSALGKLLAETGHEGWAREECESMCDPARYGFDPDSQYLRIRGAGALPPHHLAVLRELAIWRDAAARAHDVPPRAFVKDDVLLDLARTPVKSVEKLNRVKGLPRPVEVAHGAAIVEATHRGLAVPPGQRPVIRSIEPTPSQRFGAESLFAVACGLCAGHAVDPGLVTSRQEIVELYRLLKERKDPSELAVMKGWRAEACGNRLADLFRGQGKIELSWSNGRLRAD